MNTSDALRELYGRITALAVGATSSTSQNVLRVELPDDFVVVLTPGYSLSGNFFPVTATRTHHGNRKTDYRFIFEGGTWTIEPGQPISDEAIRRCLTPEGPIAIN